MGFMHLISNVLSAYTIVSCIFLKVPQINNARRHKTADGLHAQPMIMEILSYTVTGVYNYAQGHALLTWMEYPIIVVQVYVLMYYYLLYTNKLKEPYVLSGIALYFGITLGFVVNIVPQWILGWMVPFCTPVGNMAKSVYVMKMYGSKSADNVSLTTWTISFSTNLSRLFTVWMDSNDKKLMLNFAVSSTMSLAVLATAAFYQYMPAKDSKDKTTNTDSKNENKNPDSKDSKNSESNGNSNNSDSKDMSKNTDCKEKSKNKDSNGKSKNTDSKDKSKSSDFKDKFWRPKSIHAD